MLNSFYVHHLTFLYRHKIPLMKKVRLLFLPFLSSFFSFAQPVSIGLFGGTANYQGDLDDKPFVPMKPAFGINAGYNISNLLSVRAGYTYATIAGSDKYSRTNFIREVRNLSFETKVSEFSVLGEFHIFNIETIRWTPYVFAGIAVYTYNPYTFDVSGNKVFLKPLSTEGQGLSQYPNRKPYSLHQAAIPFGGGIKYSITDRVAIGLQLGIRKLFTDYFDDLSTSYVDPSILLAERGQLAVDLSYRGDEFPGETPYYPDNGYPVKETPRGSPTAKDWYYITGLQLNFKLGGGGASGAFRGGKGGYGCPSVPL